MSAIDLEHARFLRDWRPFIHKWVDLTVRRQGGSQADIEDVRQAAYEEAWAAHLGWKELPDRERTKVEAKKRIGRAVKDATRVHWHELRGVPRDDRQRGAGRRAQVLRATLAQIAATELNYVEDRIEAHTHNLIAYQLLMVGLVHGDAGLEPPDTRVLHQEVRQRLAFAIQKLEPKQHELIVGYYFEERSFKQIGQELGIQSSSSVSRLHFAALRVLRDEMIAFASSLSPRTSERTDDEPTPSA